MSADNPNLQHPQIHISIRAEEVFNLGNFPFTNSLLLAFVVLLLLGGIAILARRKLKLIPGIIQSAFEVFLESLLGIMDTAFGERAKSEKYLPLVATIFLFVLFSNWFGLLPGVGSLILKDKPLLRAPSADLNFTLGLAIVSVITANVFGAFALGIRQHLGKFFNFKNPVSFFLGLIELISEGAKMISFSFRLFGNIFAGEVLLTIVAFLVPYFAPLPFLFLEVFVGLVQALIFSLLTTVFIALATASHGEETSSAH